MNDLSGLNAEQRAAVEHIAGPLLILAGPGSGKTRVVTHRIAYLIDVCGVRPYSIMAVTFTNKAAREMKERLQSLVPKDFEQITIGTFHSICSRLLRREGSAIGLDSRFVIYDDDDQYSLIRRVLKELNLDEKAYSPRALLSSISAAKSELIAPLQYAEHASSYWEEVVSRVYRRYQDFLAANSGLDFDDLLVTAVRLFRERPDVLERYQSRYVHLLVDEFQDTNIAQYVLVKMLGDRHRNVCVVGDEDQSIYSWRQADIRNILKFESDFSDAKTVYLVQNYRSTKTILSAARSVISVNSMRKDKNLWTANEEGVPISLFEAYNEEEEANFVVREIERLIASGRYSAGDCAVMYRANAQSRVLERMFLRHKLPHKLVGVRFYQRKEIKDILAYLRIAYNPYDNVSMNRIINVPSRGLGDRTVAELHRWAEQLGVNVWDALRLLRGEAVPGIAMPETVAIPFNTRAQQLLLNVTNIFAEIIDASNRMPLPRLIQFVLRSSGYEELLEGEGEEGAERLENIKELLTVAGQYAQLEPQLALSSFLEETALATDVDEFDDKENAVTLITLHGAKGLEYPVVFMVGLEEGLCPHSRSFDDLARMEEERRLCYVGMTRARDRLYLIHAIRRSIYGSIANTTPSRFISDIPDHLIRESGGNDRPSFGSFDNRSAPTGKSSPFGKSSPAGQGAAAGKGAPRLRWSAPPSASAPIANARSIQSERDSLESRKVRPTMPTEAAFNPGDKVRHPTFGEGIVVNCTVVANDQEVSIAFPQVGVKRLSLSFAPLEKL